MTKDAERRTRRRALAEAMFVDPEHNATAFRIAFDPAGVLALLDEIDRLLLIVDEMSRQRTEIGIERARLARRVEVGEEAVVVLRKFLPPRAWWTQRTAKALAAWDQASREGE